MTHPDTEPDPNAVFLALAYAESDIDRQSIAYAVAIASLNAGTERLHAATEALLQAESDRKRNRGRLRWFRRSP